MIKYIFLAAFTILLVPTLGSGGCLVEMKNGHKFVSSECWEENDQVMLYLYGGKVGFHKGLVKNIEKTSGNVVIESTPSEGIDQEDTQEEASDKGAEDKQETKKSAPLAATETVSINPALEDSLKNERADLAKERKQATADFNQAKESGGDAARKEALRRISELDSRQNDLLKRVQKAYNGELPAWWAWW